jgi:hypothetical protein
MHRSCGVFFAAVLIVLSAKVPASGGPKIGDCEVFPSNNIWNVPVDHLPIDPRSDSYINTIGRSVHLHPDFGSGLWPPDTGGPIGIPFVEVPSNQPRVPISFQYSDESDPGPYPIPPDAPIEGGPQSDGDRHVLVLDSDECLLYEVFYAFPQNGGSSWAAGSGAVFDLGSNALRPSGWTSADAAGLPILPGLVRYDEVASGEIKHAIRFTAPQTRRAWVWPARHYASNLTGEQYPPMGQRFRLRSDFDLSPFDPQIQVILRALKQYGMILADNGSPWFISGVPDERWDDEILSQLRSVKGKDFEAVDASSLMLNPDSAAAVSQKVKFFPQMLDGRDGDIRFYTNLFFMNAGERTPITVEFFDSTGDPWVLTFGVLGQGSKFTFYLDNGESRSIETLGPTRPQVGYARLRVSDEVACMSVVIGMDVPSEVIFYEAGVPVSEPLSRFTIFLDSLHTRNTGLALVNPPVVDGGGDATVIMRLYDPTAKYLGAQTLPPLPVGHHLPRFIHQLIENPELARQAEEMLGTVTFESNRPVAALTLRQNDGPARDFQNEVPVFTTFPVVPGELIKNLVEERSSIWIEDN